MPTLRFLLFKCFIIEEAVWNLHFHDGNQIYDLGGSGQEWEASTGIKGADKTLKLSVIRIKQCRV